MNNSKLADTIRLKAIHKLGSFYTYSYLDSANYYADKEIAFAEKVKQYRWVAGGLTTKGIVAYNKGFPNEALKFHQEAMKVREMHKLSSQHVSWRNMVNIYLDYGDIKTALYYVEKLMKHYEEKKDTLEIADTYSLYAYAFLKQKEYEEAKANYHKSLALYKKLNYPKESAASLNSIGTLFNDLNNPDSALIYYKKALEVTERSGEITKSAFIYVNMGVIENNKKNREGAMRYYLNALEIGEKTGSKEITLAAHIDIANVYFAKGDLRNAESHAIIAFKLAEEISAIENYMHAAELMCDVYRLNGNYKGAYEMYELAIRMKDSLVNENNRKGIISQQLKYEYEKKAAADSVKASEEKKVVDAQLKQEKTQRLALYGGLGLVGIFALFMVNRFRVTNKQKKLIEEQKKTVETQKHLVEEKQKEIIDSIKYAKRIQTALITNEYYIHNKLNNLK